MGIMNFFILALCLLGVFAGPTEESYNALLVKRYYYSYLYHHRMVRYYSYRYGHSYRRYARYLAQQVTPKTELTTPRLVILRRYRYRYHRYFRYLRYRYRYYRYHRYYYRYRRYYYRR